MSARIHDHAIIGDGRSAALVTNDGSVDWLCWPRFDSASVFASLLDPDRGGYFRIAPRQPGLVSRRYLEETNVLETRFETTTGSVLLTDCMTIAEEHEKRRLAMPEHELLRRVRCERGDVELEIAFVPRPDYGRARPRLRDKGPLGIRLQLGATLLCLRSQVHLSLHAEDSARATVFLHEGEQLDFSLTFDTDGPATLPSLGVAATERIARTVRWWREWVERASYDGPHRESVIRSVLAVKLLSFAPSGAVIAAPTTSLPERLGGDLNWDYRYCWLRDGAFTSRALYRLGYAEDASAFCSWLLHATRLTLPQVRVLYDVYGRAPGPERVLSHLAGYRGSRPVRIGNAAHAQLQLDSWGEVVDAVSRALERGAHVDRQTQRLLRELGEYVCHHWEEPDSGLWEVRGPARHYTHARVLSWTALDRLIDLHQRKLIRDVPLEKFLENRELIRREVETRGFNSRLGCYTQRLDGDTVDASLLLLSWYGFHPANHPRMRATYERIRERLGVGPGLYHRYEESREAGEGAFGICSFWAAEFLADGGGSLDEARGALDAACGYSNDVGLFGEEILPATGEAHGNFPQAYTHLGMINAALSLADRESGERRRARSERVPERDTSILQGETSR